MKTNEEIQEEYRANPEKWIPLWRFPTIENAYQKRWTKVLDDVAYIRNDDDRAEYKLIHIRHEDVLDAYLADNNVEIERKSNVHQGWIEDTNFIEYYQEWLEYRIKEKEDAEPKNVEPINDNIMRVSPTMGMEVNSFTAHGFEVPSWDGEILKERSEYFIGYFETKENHIFPILWDKYSGEALQYRDIKVLGDKYNLTPIKKEWYENPDNFPCLVSSGHNFAYVATQSRIDEYLNYGWKLATKDELMSLYYKED